MMTPVRPVPLILLLSCVCRPVNNRGVQRKDRRMVPGVAHEHQAKQRGSGRRQWWMLCPVCHLWRESQLHKQGCKTVIVSVGLRDSGRRITFIVECVVAHGTRRSYVFCRIDCNILSIKVKRQIRCFNHKMLQNTSKIYLFPFRDPVCGGGLRRCHQAVSEHSGSLQPKEQHVELHRRDGHETQRSRCVKVSMCWITLCMFISEYWGHSTITAHWENCTHRKRADHFRVESVNLKSVKPFMCKEVVAEKGHCT